jgi:lipopolysaccharide export system ATP-binding protein
MQLKINNIKKHFKKRVILNGVSLTLEKGQIASLIGPNGSGKTTLFNIIMGLTTADSGNIWLGRRNISLLATYIRARLGLIFLPQQNSVFSKLTVENNIKAVLQPQRLSDKAQKAEIMRLIELLNLVPLQKSLAENLSGGERRRVEIARALATKPHFMLLDEPFTGLDPISRRSLTSNLQNLAYNHNIGFFIIDHDADALLAMSDYNYFMYQSHLVTEGLKQEIVKNKLFQDYYLGDRKGDRRLHEQ